MKLRKKITFKIIKNAFIDALRDTYQEEQSTPEEDRWVRLELWKNGLSPSLEKFDKMSIKEIENLKNK